MDNYNEKPYSDEELHSDETPFSYEELHSDHLSGELVSNSVPGLSSFNIIRVKTGEDIAMKIMSHAQQGSQSICVISANGAISSANLRKPDSSGGTFTFGFQGHCEILSLNGSFTPTENGGRCEWLSVSLTGPDGRVIGGGVAGQLIAGSPVQIVVGCFFPGNMRGCSKETENGVLPECSRETENGVLPECSRETKRQKTESTTFVAPPAVIYLPSAEMADPSYGQRALDTMNQNLSSLSSSGDNRTAYPSDSRNEPTGNATSSE